jgi:hypothetical protein
LRPKGVNIGQKEST